jgi:hypothetical protein
MTSLSLPNCGTIGQHVDFNTCPQLTSVNLTQLAGGGSLIDFHGCSSLVSLNLPNVADVQQVLFTGCTVLQTFTMPTLATIRNTYNGSGNAALVTLGIGVAIFTLNNSTINMSSCALNAASINAILARGVASAHTAYTYTLNLGTNAAPSGQGVADKATLIGQGNTVTTN